MIREHDVKTVLNFGVSYGYTDAVLAKMFPGALFIGIDRAPETQKFNEELFSVANLRFATADIMDYLSEPQPPPAVLAHIRTAVLLPKSFVASLYAKCHASGIDYIYGLEPYGLSRQTLDFPAQSPDDRPSYPFRNGMLLHNYQSLLLSAGYSMQWGSYIKTNHKDADYRLFAFVGKRM